MHAAGMIVIGQVLDRFLGIVDVRGAGRIIAVIVIIVMMQNLLCMLGHVLDDERRPMHTAISRKMRDIALHGSKRLPWQQQHQKYQKRLFHVG